MVKKLLIFFITVTVFSGCDLEKSLNGVVEGGGGRSLVSVQNNSDVNYINDVESRFLQIRQYGDYLAAWENGKVQNYTGTINNHFQGIQRLKSGQYVVVSGSDTNVPSSHIFIIKMGSRSSDGRLRSNLLQSSSPDTDDKVVKAIAIDNVMWHAGGLSVLGDILAVPLEGDDSGKIIFYDMTDPENPILYNHYIDRPNAKSGAIALTRVENGKYLVAAWSDSDSLPKRIDFYLSSTTDFDDGFDSNSYTTWYHTAVQAANGQDANFSNFQAVNFVSQADGQLYLVGLHNSSSLAPVINGEDWADLYTVEFSNNDYTTAPVITKVANRHFYCKDNQGNFDAAAGIYTDENGNMGIYSAYFYTEDSLLKFTEFRWVEDSSVVDINKSWVELYKDDSYGNNNIIVDYCDRNLRDYSDYESFSFGDSASSAIWLIPQGYQYLLFQHSDYKGKLLKLQGSGDVSDINDLEDYDFGDYISSSRYSKTLITDISDSWIELFEDDTFRGRRLSIIAGNGGSITNYKYITVEGDSGFNDEVSSIRYQLPDGVSYKLYKDSNYSGNYITLVGTGGIDEIHDLRDLNFGDEISSSRF